MGIVIEKSIHYLYRHIRLDKNEPFYIGIGTVVKNEKINSHQRYYRRAYSKAKRNNFWNRLIQKTEYEVEILLESEDYEFIKQKEIEFIALYGRRDLRKGTLTNLTDGGENGVLTRTKESIEKQKSYYKLNPHPTKGVPRTEEAKEKMRKACKGRGKGKLNYFYGKKLIGKDNKNSKRVINTETNIIYNSIKEASEKEYHTYSTLKSRLNGGLPNNTNLKHY